MNQQGIKVLIVDDSAVVRQVLGSVLEQEPGIEVLGTASDPIFAMAKMKNAWPDVIVLDVEMPRMDGITFLRELMGKRPTPVVICSTLTERGTQTSMDAMQAGAVSIVTKPKAGLKDFLQDSTSDIIHAVKAAARAKVGKLATSPLQVKPKLSADAVISSGQPAAMAKTTEHLVALGTSTGGTQALESVLSILPRVCPGIVIVQHMPEKFTAAFADRLNGLCEIEVKEAEHNDRVMPGCALIAPGGRHLLVKRSGAQYYVEVIKGPLVNRHIPSVDVMFRSVARSAGNNALGIIMTGMGDDGAAGLLEMRQAGASTMAQDETSSVVYGMPKAAVKNDAAQKVINLAAIPQAILDWRS